MAPATTEPRLTPAARRVLDTAAHLFYTRGITTVGMDLIADEAGVTKKTIYDRFGSKQNLVTAYLRARDHRWRHHLTTRLDAAGPDPRARILATYDALHAWTRAENTRGCAMVNAYAELSDPDHPGRRVAEEQKTWLHALYTRLLADAALPAAHADTLLILHEGAVTAAAVAALPDAALTARDAADRLLGTTPP
ncbi:TetR/AcrR family transcriptional regulator [Nocardiopsis trehalosi]|uniref:TetR/AcrR family transcriptional regulator n=1 Tax=Nocardiopsis trehalosi TaxID=109329 RepID=UPI0008330990|nr:TetR/AcrR family transcriptional regulator [Nocardiopsis trehalosi]